MLGECWCVFAGVGRCCEVLDECWCVCACVVRCSEVLDEFWCVCAGVVRCYEVLVSVEVFVQVLVGVNNVVGKFYGEVCPNCRGLFLAEENFTTCQEIITTF